MCLHAKHVFSNQFGWYLSFICVIAEKCVYVDNIIDLKNKMEKKTTTKKPAVGTVPWSKYCKKKRGTLYIYPSHTNTWPLTPTNRHFKKKWRV